LKTIFKVGGEIPNTKYIFIGDFVDRGNNSVETIEYLLCLKSKLTCYHFNFFKVKYPGHILLLRGNHESRQCT